MRGLGPQLCSLSPGGSLQGGAKMLPWGSLLRVHSPVEAHLDSQQTLDSHVNHKWVFGAFRGCLAKGPPTGCISLFLWTHKCVWGGHKVVQPKSFNKISWTKPKGIGSSWLTPLDDLGAPQCHHVLHYTCCKNSLTPSRLNNKCIALKSFMWAGNQMFFGEHPHSSASNFHSWLVLRSAYGEEWEGSTFSELYSPQMLSDSSLSSFAGGHVRSLPTQTWLQPK